MAENKWTKEQQAKIIARAWKDEDFRNKFINDPKEALKEYGIEISANAEFTVLSEDANHFYFVLPTSPVNANDLSSSELENIAAAGCKWGGCSVGSAGSTAIMESGSC